MKRDTPTRATVIVVGLFGGGLIMGTMFGDAAVARATDPYAQLDIFARVLTTIETDYVEEVDPDRLVDAAIVGMARELDAQSGWLSSEQYRRLQDETEGTRTGLGIEIKRSEDAIEVVRVLEGSPARRDGIETGDQILEVDGVAVGGLDSDELDARFTGDRGEETVLTILREGWSAPRQIHTIRDQIHMPSVESGLVDGAIGYVRLVQFQEGSAREIRVAVDGMAEKAGGQLDGLILDLRDNPGGLLTEAVAVSDLFLDEGVIVSTRGRPSRHDDVAETHHATEGGFGSDLRIVTVVNGWSASASEIVASALQDTHRGLVVGERTYGKGTVQQLYRHLQPDRAALKLTVGRYYTPSGEPVAAHEGRKPDIEVLYPRVQSPIDALSEALDTLALTEAQRAELASLVAEIPAPEAKPMGIPWDEPLLNRFASDPQLQRAAAAVRDGK